MMSRPGYGQEQDRCQIGRESKHTDHAMTSAFGKETASGRQSSRTPRAPDDAGGPDMFLHISALQAAGIDPENLRRGDRLSFDVESTREGKTRAGNVRRPG